MSTHYESTEQIKPELLDRLAQQAKARGDTVNGLLQRMLDESEATSAPLNEFRPAEMSPQERAKAWREWTTNHSVLVPNPVDVSRESIYTREDDAL